MNIYEKNPNFKGKPSFKKWFNYCQRYGHSIAECRQKQQDNQNKPQKYKVPNKSFYQYMKKDQNLLKKSNNSSGKPHPNNSNYSRNQSPYNSNYRSRSPEQRNSRNFSQNRYSRSNSQNNQYRNNYSRSNSNRREISDTSSHSNSRNRHYSNDRSRNSSYNRNRNYSNNRNRSYSNNRNTRYQNNRSRNNSYNRSNYQGNRNDYYNRSRNNSQSRNPNYNNQRNYSQSPYRNNNRYPDSQHKYRSNTPKHQRQIIQVQTTEETTSDPPGIDNTESTELQLNHINCESTDTESDTDNTISVNIITVENDYEPIIYEQPFSSHIYENPLVLLHNCYTRLINNNTRTTQEVNEINTVIKPDKKDEVQCSNTKHIYQNIQKEQPREKIWTIPFLLESPRSKEFQPPGLEIDFLIDSGAESNIINIPTWNEIERLHPNLTPLETSSKLATAQGSTLVNYGKIQLFLVPTKTMEQNKIFNKPFKQTFHITDIKHNIIGIPFITKYIPTINILNSKIHIKVKYTKTKNILSKIKQTTTIFLKILPHL